MSREAAAIRDIPASCTCAWKYLLARMIRITPNPHCDWHSRRAVA